MNKIVEALLNDTVDLTTHQWKVLVEEEIDNSTSDGELMRILSRMPIIMRHGRAVLSLKSRDQLTISKLLLACNELHDRLGPVFKSMRSRLDTSDLSLLSEYIGPSSQMAFVHASFSRSYALASMAGCMLNRITCSLGNSVDSLEEESLLFAQEIIVLAHLARKNRPLGSQYMLACLPGAYVATDDPTIKDESAKLMEEYRVDAFGVTSQSPQEELNWLKQRFILRESRAYKEVFTSYV